MNSSIIPENAKSDYKDGARVASNAKHDLAEMAHDAGTKVRHLFDSASSEISHATDVVSAQVRNKPLQSSLIALTAGFVLGALLRR